MSLKHIALFCVFLVSRGTWADAVSWRQNITFNRGWCVDYCQFEIFTDQLLKYLLQQVHLFSFLKKLLCWQALLSDLS